MACCIHQAFLISICFFTNLCSAGDPPVYFYNFVVSYMTAPPLGVPQLVIAINGEFPGPTINVTTNTNVVVNVRNKLDEDLLMTWAGIKQKGASWQEGYSAPIARVLRSGTGLTKSKSLTR
ncbi:hypothetical protein Vadar_021102 [Vaccinium darrowii]|uniref:Uncharacterized protein n=1 Tax=Vaccinium darrowii TaxID=229202 RepID=A0ACB7XJD0_9ERIC|nr:hypothetical protein Vadar_021102 [Vaccinium darrowii]